MKALVIRGTEGNEREQGLAASTEDLAMITHILGRVPRSYADFIAEQAEAFFQALEAA